MAVPDLARREIAPALSGSSHLGLLPGSTIRYVGTDRAHAARNQTQETTVHITLWFLVFDFDSVGECATSHFPVCTLEIW
eukprot:3797512-Rhodomonas_salina.1